MKRKPSAREQNQIVYDIFFSVVGTAGYVQQTDETENLGLQTKQEN